MPSQTNGSEHRDADYIGIESSASTDGCSSRIFEGHDSSDKKLISLNEDTNEPQANRSLRFKNESGKSTRRDYTDLAGFNPRDHIRQLKSGQRVYLALETRMNGDYFVNSPYFANIAQNLMNKNGDNRLPYTIQEAREDVESDDWEMAVKAELDTLKKNIIGNRWVFSKKFDENGILCRFKARLVAQGFS